MLLLFGAGIGAAALAASLAAFARWTLKVDNVEDAVRQLQLGIDSATAELGASVPNFLNSFDYPNTPFKINFNFQQ